MLSRPSRTLTFSLLIAFSAAVALVRADVVPPKTTELGNGPTIVFVHGLGLGRNDWLPTARKLIARYRVVLVDLPGHGDTPLPDPFSLPNVGNALDAVLAKQNPESTIVVGHQMGGRAALAALAAHAGRARGLVLIDVPVGTPIPIDDQQKKQFLDFMDQNYDQVANRLFTNLGRDTTQSKAIWAVFSQTSPGTVRAYIRESFFTDGNKDAKAVKVPIQLVMTSRVWKANGTPGAALKNLGWDDTTAAAIRVPESGYWVMKDQPDSLASIISRFADARLLAKK